MTFDLKLVQNGGEEERGHILHHLVSHTLPLAHRERLKMFRLLECVVLLDESFRIVSLRFVPIVFAEIRVVIVDEDDSVGLDLVPFNN